MSETQTEYDTPDGIYYDMPFADYQSVKAINASCIVVGKKSMLHMHHAMNKPSGKPSPAMRFGTLAHHAVLEDGKRFRICDESKATKAYKAMAESLGAEAEYLLSSDEFAEVTAMRESVMTEPTAAYRIKSTRREVSMFWTGSYGRAKARLDGYSERLIWDYKTTKDITVASFWKTAENMAYLVKMGWYQEAVEKITGKKLPVSFVVQEQDAPFDRWVCNIPDEFIAQGRKQAVEIAMEYRCAEMTNCFLGVQQGTVQFERPAWAIGGNNADEINMEGVE
jgi:hypothetical protein